MAAIGLALAATGCGVPDPIKVQVDADATGRIAPTTPQYPLVPALLPWHRCDPAACLVAVVDVDGLASRRQRRRTRFLG